jgi:preprotein translocase subunit SecG
MKNRGGVAMTMLVTAVFVVACLVLIASILLQSGKRAGLSGSIGGGAEQIWGKKQASGMEAMFDKMTKVAAIVFIAGALLLVVMQ